MALPTLYAAKKYILPILEEACRDVQIKNLSSANIWETYSTSLAYADNGLHEACKMYFKDSITKVEDALKSPDFLTIPPLTFLDLLQINVNKTEKGKTPQGILIADIELFKSCNAWAEAECLRQEKDPSGENKREVLGEGLFCIRFPDMLPADIVSIVNPTGILTLEERIHLLDNINGGEKTCRKFPSKDENIVLVKFDQSGEEVRESSLTTKSEVNFSTIKVQPQHRLVLSAIIVKPVLQGKGEYEVTITKEHLRDDKTYIKGESACEGLSISCTLIESESLEGSTPESKKLQFPYLDLKENCFLDVGYVYYIKVALLRKLASKPRSKVLRRVSLLSDQLGLKVDGISNGNITALTLDLL